MIYDIISYTYIYIYISSVWIPEKDHVPMSPKIPTKVTRKDAAATAIEAFRTAFSWRSLSITWATKGLSHQPLRWC